MLDAAVAFCIYILESFSASVLENSSGRCRRNVNDDNNEAEALLPENPLGDFSRFDPNDTIFQEFDPPSQRTGRLAWKESRPRFWKSFLDCLKNVFVMQFVAGSMIGLLAFTIVLLDFNTADLCYEMTMQWNSMPQKIQRVRAASQSVEGFVIQLWHFTTMSQMFGFSLMKELNLLTINLLAAFADLSYRLYLQLFGVYKRYWMSYPLNTLFSFMLFVNSWIIARRLEPDSRKRQFKVALLLSVQFLFGIPVTFFLVYKIFPWYNEKNELQRAIIAAISPVIVCIPKVITRIAALKLDLVHPGVLHVLVTVLYTGSAVVFRVMQAELTNFTYFVALGVGHAIIDLVERVTVTMRDHIWEYLYTKLNRHARSSRRLQAGQARTPRSMRFVADVSIQLLLSEPTALVSAVGFSQLYKFMYPDSSESLGEYKPYVWEFLRRCTAGLAIDVVFNTFSVWLQIMVFNVAVLKVWKVKWRWHVVFNAVCIISVVMYYTEYLFGVVRSKHDAATPTRFAFNCSAPFSRF